MRRRLLVLAMVWLTFCLSACSNADDSPESLLQTLNQALQAANAQAVVDCFTEADIHFAQAVSSLVDPPPENTAYTLVRNMPGVREAMNDGDSPTLQGLRITTSPAIIEEEDAATAQVRIAVQDGKEYEVEWRFIRERSGWRIQPPWGASQ